MSDELELTTTEEDEILQSDSETNSDENSTGNPTFSHTLPSISDKDITEISRSTANLGFVQTLKNNNTKSDSETNSDENSTGNPTFSHTLPSISDKDITEISRSTDNLGFVQTPKNNNTKRQREPSEEETQNTSQSNKGPPIKKIKKVMMAPPQVETAEQQQKFIIRLVPDIENVHLFTKTHLDSLHTSVLKELKNCKNPNVKYDYCQPDRGRYKFVCPNEEARNFGLNIVPTLTGLWEDPKIKAVDFGLIPKLTRATVTFNNPPPETLDFFEELDFKNDNIDTNDWRVYGKKKVKGNKTVFFLGIDDKSVEDLKAIGYRPYFVNGRVKITIDNNNQDN